MNGSTKTPSLFTIGYEGRTASQFIAALQETRVTLLCDIRRNPISRKPGFSKRGLAVACDAAAIRYEHLPELGIPSAERKHVKSAADRAALFQRYEAETLPRETDALVKILRWVRDEHERVALLCFERDPAECHRLCVALALTANGGLGSRPIHL